MLLINTNSQLDGLVRNSSVLKWPRISMSKYAKIKMEAEVRSAHYMAIGGI